MYVNFNIFIAATSIELSDGIFLCVPVHELLRIMRINFKGFTDYLRESANGETSGISKIPSLVYECYVKQTNPS